MASFPISWDIDPIFYHEYHCIIIIYLIKWIMIVKPFFWCTHKLGYLILSYIYIYIWDMIWYNPLAFKDWKTSSFSQRLHHHGSALCSSQLLRSAATVVGIAPEASRPGYPSRRTKLPGDRQEIYWRYTGGFFHGDINLPYITMKCDFLVEYHHGDILCISRWYKGNCSWWLILLDDWIILWMVAKSEAPVRATIGTL